MYKVFQVVISAYFLLFLCSSCQRSTADAALVAALTSFQLSEIESAASKGANLDNVVVDGKNVNPILYIWNEAPRKIFVERLLKLTANVNYADKDGITLLMYASGAKPQDYNFYSPTKNYSSLDYCKLFLEYGANVADTDKQGWSAMDYAVQLSGNTDALKLLLEYNAEVTQQTLQLALEKGKNGYCEYEKIQLLGKELLFRAVETGLLPIVEASLIGKSVQVKELLETTQMCSQEEKIWVLFNSAAFCDVGTLQKLISFGYGDIMSLDANGDTLLCVAARCGNAKTVNWLLNARQWDTSDIQLAFRSAVRNNQLTTTKKLLDSGATISSTRNDWVVFDNILDDAVICGNIDMIQLLSQYGYPINDNTALYAMKNAAKHGQVNVIKYFVSLGYNPDYGSEDTNADPSVLSDACWAEQVDVVSYLITIGCNVNAQQKCLPLAVDTGNASLVQLLLDAHAKINSVTANEDGSQGESALTIAERYGYKHIIELLTNA